MPPPSMFKYPKMVVFCKSWLSPSESHLSSEAQCLCCSLSAELLEALEALPPLGKGT